MVNESEVQGCEFWKKNNPNNQFKQQIYEPNYAPVRDGLGTKGMYVIYVGKIGV